MSPPAKSYGFAVSTIIVILGALTLGDTLAADTPPLMKRRIEGFKAALDDPHPGVLQAGSP